MNLRGGEKQAWQKRNIEIHLSPSTPPTSDLTQFTSESPISTNWVPQRLKSLGSIKDKRKRCPPLGASSCTFDSAGMGGPPNQSFLASVDKSEQLKRGSRGTQRLEIFLTSLDCVNISIPQPGLLKAPSPDKHSNPKPFNSFWASRVRRSDRRPWGCHSDTHQQSAGQWVCFPASCPTCPHDWPSGAPRGLGLSPSKTSPCVICPLHCPEVLLINHLTSYTLGSFAPPPATPAPPPIHPLT